MESVLDLLHKELICLTPSKWRKVVTEAKSSGRAEGSSSSGNLSSASNYSYLNGTDSSVHSMLIFENSLVLCEAIRWTNSLCNNALELLSCELENCARLLYISTRPR